MSTSTPNVNAASEVDIAAPANTIWNILAEDFGGIHKWASGVNASEGSNPSLEGGHCSGRACKIAATGFSDTKERIVDFDSENYILKYALFHGLPGFVKDAYNSWHLIPKEDITQVIAATEMRATGLMGWMMKGFMAQSTQKVLDAMCRELKHYAETGEPHPDKKKAMARYNRKKKKS
ncbi:SRPBCC family protein [Flagellimonas sp. S174]|uniref:SRPBCC family protein n=1 Tax=Flagellimonas sp. S174 TaxID=3410790 RepID=UPI003BF4F091